MEFHIVHLRILDCSGNSVCAPSYIINILFISYLRQLINLINPRFALQLLDTESIRAELRVAVSIFVRCCCHIWYHRLAVKY